MVLSSEVNFDEITNISWDSIRKQQQQLFIDEMNKKYLDLQQQESQPEEEPPPPIEESPLEKELKILNYKK